MIRSASNTPPPRPSTPSPAVSPSPSPAVSPSPDSADINSIFDSPSREESLQAIDFSNGPTTSQASVTSESNPESQRSSEPTGGGALSRLVPVSYPTNVAALLNSASETPPDYGDSGSLPPFTAGPSAPAARNVPASDATSALAGRANPESSDVFDQDRSANGGERQSRLDSAISNLRSLLSQIIHPRGGASSEVGPPTAERYATRFTADQDPARQPREFPDSNNPSPFHSAPVSPGGTATLFHGTTRDGAHSIRENGFQLQRQDGGVTDAMRMENPNVGSHHYYTTSPMIAENMARTAAGAFGEPAVVKVKLPEEYRKSLWEDPRFPPLQNGRNHAFMSRYDTPDTFIEETRNLERLLNNFRGANRDS